MRISDWSSDVCSSDLASMALTVFFGRPSGILMACEGEQRERYLLPAAHGEKFDALAMSEPDAGSDVRGMKCAARPAGGDWVLHGKLGRAAGRERGCQHVELSVVAV